MHSFIEIDAADYFEGVEVYRCECCGVYSATIDDEDGIIVKNEHGYSALCQYCAAEMTIDGGVCLLLATEKTKCDHQKCIKFKCQHFKEPAGSLVKIEEGE